MEASRPIEESSRPPPEREASPPRTRPAASHLAELAADPERLGAILRAAEAVFPDVPPLRSALTAWLVLLAARKSLPPEPRTLAYGLWTQGWKLVEPTDRPRAGDVFLLAGPDRRPIHVGIVAKVSMDGSWFTAIDDTVGPGEHPCRRTVAGDADLAPVASFLRFG